MMRKVLIAVVLVTFATSAVLMASNQMTGTQKVDPAVSKISSAYQAANNAKDIAKLLSLYTDDAIEMPPNRPMMKGKAAIEAYHKGNFAEGDSNLSITPTDSTVTGAFGYETGTYKNTIKMKTGETMNETGKYVVVLKRGADNQWRVSHAIYNTDQPTPPMPAKKPAN